jgi:hypothetical protein
LHTPHLTAPLSLFVSKARVALTQVPSLLWDLGMSYLVFLFLYMTLIYFVYTTILYQVVFVYMGDMFLCSSHVHYLEDCVHYLYNMFPVFVRSLEARVVREHDH